MTRSRVITKEALTLAGSDLARLLSIAQAAGGAFAVTVVHTPEPARDALAGDEPACAVIKLDEHASVVDLRALFLRCPSARLVFIAELPLRHAVAHLIREHGHAVLARSESPLVIMATVAALLAGDGES